MAARAIAPMLDFAERPMSTIFINSYVHAGGGWTPASPTTDGGVLPHTWLEWGVANYQDAAKTTPADEIGDEIGAMVNQGSDTYDVTQATTASKPTLQQVTINDVVSYVGRFDGVDDFLQGAFGGGAISQPFTAFAVAQLDATAVNNNSGYYLLDGDDTAGKMGHLQNTAPTPDAWALSGGEVLNGAATNSNWNVWTSLFSGASSNLWHNGVLMASGNAGTQTPDGATVGAYVTGGFRWKGDIGQILIYPGNLSTADKNQIGEYLEGVTGIVWTAIV